MSEMKKSRRASSSDLLSSIPNPGSNTPNVTLGMQKQSFFQRFSIRQLFCSQFVPSHRGKNKSSKISKRKGSPFMETRSESGSSEIGTHSRSNSIIQNEKGHTSRDSNLLECPLCMEILPRECFPNLITCHHLSCSSCLQQYFKIEITEARVNITCPQCAECMHPTDLYAIVNDLKIMLKYEEFMLRRILAVDPDTRWCPAPDCSYAVIASGCAGCPKLKCERPGCSTYFCYHCKAEWHPNQTCDTARALRSPYSQEANMNYSLDSVSKDQIKPCPRCSVLIVKMDDGSCNHMTCAVCSAEFCWLCMKEISDLHYLSPSGCTFWGKKPWSRKKKIMWQLGTLVGAPVGIALVAGISVPAMIIGIPVWVGRKVYSHYQNSNKHKRNLAMTGGVTASVLISPVLAALAVGIGVPILLFYVYGVVPIFLCRSGGCGVITSASGVRIDFDEDSDDTNFKSDAHLLEIMGGRANYPRRSRAGSVSLDDSSQLDPPELSCNQVLTGASRCPSVNSNLAGTHSHRMDSVSNQRYSLSNDSASGTVSLSDKSANIQLDGISNVSNVALAGSLLNYKFNNEGTTPVEVHVDSNLDKAEDGTFQHLPSVSPVSSFSGEDLLSSFRRSGRKRMVIDRQASENGSLWSQDDTYSERVRFDDNVSFIDEESASQGAQLESSSYHGARPKWNKHTVLQCDNNSTTLEDCDEKESRNSSSSIPEESKCNMKSSQSWTNLDHRIMNTLNSKSASCIITS